jgi:hypothetical protein
MVPASFIRMILLRHRFLEDHGRWQIFIAETALRLIRFEFLQPLLRARGYIIEPSRRELGFFGIAA